VPIADIKGLLERNRSEVYFQQLTANNDSAGLMHLLNQLCVVACFVVAQKCFSNQSERFPLLSSEYFVEFINICNIVM